MEAEVTSPSGNEARGPLAREATSPSDGAPDAAGGPGAAAAAATRGGRGRGRGGRAGRRAGRARQWQRQPRADATSAPEATSESTEAARVSRAGKRWEELAQETRGGRGRGKRHRIAAPDDEEEHTSSSEWKPVTGPGPATTPRTSGVTDYLEWATSTALSVDERGSLPAQYNFIDFCAGMGTSLLCASALELACARVLPAGSGATCPHGVAVAVTEKNDEKLRAIGRMADAMVARRGSRVPRTLLFKDTADTATSTPTTRDGELVATPVAELLFMGIVCKDVSGCSTTPKSILDEEGASGHSWAGARQYLRALQPDQLPWVIVLECVDRLGHHRKINGKVEQGSEIIQGHLEDLGYCGSWRRINAKHFYLPQSRRRIWGMFVRLWGFGRERQAEQLRRAWEIIDACQMREPEPLCDLLRRVPPPHAAEAEATGRRRATARPSQGVTPTHAEKLEKCTQQWGLTHEQLLDGKAEFDVACGDLLVQREREVLWLQLCRLKMEGRVQAWTEAPLLVWNAGDSIGRSERPKPDCPCVRPNKKFIAIQRGSLTRISDHQLLALQGVGPTEFEWLRPGAKTSLSDLAGNAFTANVCGAFLLAALVVLRGRPSEEH
ncbi:unnamed protein product [Prorocentrum cordatum]|uniref:DNA (cytosine-5-)-methyltransferase n=1 Tax=Prorocentrum cordatum TaxID=2364126 RepID=A0ABN9R6R7_9DINO|nr:unnamed protein product [Polarella glacialis]